MNGMSGIVVIGVEREGGTAGDEETSDTPARGNVLWKMTHHIANMRG